MKMLLSVERQRILRSIGWAPLTLLIEAASWLAGAEIGYLCEDMGFVQYSFPLEMLAFPVWSCIITAVILHIVRIRSWKKLHYRCIDEYTSWTWKCTLAIAIFEEMVWISVFIILLEIWEMLPL